MQWLCVVIFAGRALKEKQCTLEGAQYMNVLGSVHWECKFFKFIIEIDQSETTKSYMFDMSLQLTNYKCVTAK